MSALMKPIVDAALAGGAMLALALSVNSAASALTLSPQSLEGPVASAQFDDVAWRGCAWGRCGGGYGRWHGGYGHWHGGYYPHYGYGAAAVAGGVLAGAVVGGALASPGYGEPYPVYGGQHATTGDEAACASHFRSYDPSSGTYLGYDGVRHPCP
jgi:BA14K-like protein